MKNSFQKLLWVIAGAEPPILEKCQTDHKKFAAIGATILMTAFIAFCAGTAAAWYFTQKGTADKGELGWALIFGIIWATLIFCIDRSLVITLKKDPSKKYQKFLVPFISRAILALVVAFMVSIPLELVIFQDYILANEPNFENNQVTSLSEQIKKTNNEVILNERIKKDEVKSDKLEKESNALGKDINEIKEKIQRLDKEKANPNSPEYNRAKNKYNIALNNYNKAKKQYNSEIQKNNPSNSTLGKYKSNMNNANSDMVSAKKDMNSAAQAWKNGKQSEIDILARELNEKKDDKESIDKNYHKTQDGIEQDRTTLRKKETDREKKVDDKQDLLKNGNHFIRNYQILEYTVYQRDENGNLTELTQLLFLWLIRLLFFIIEILPTTVKIVSPIGSYERMVYAEEEEMKKYLTSSEYLERIRNIHNIELNARENLLKSQHDSERELQEAIIEKVKKAQYDVAEAAISQWREVELKKITDSSKKTKEIP